MKIIMVSGDRKLFDKKSAVYARHMRYGEVVDEIHVIVSSRSSMHLHKQQIAENVWVYPTDSFSRWVYPFDAFRIGKRLPKPDLVVGQDPFENGLAARWIAKYHSAKLQLQVHTDFLNPYFAKHSFLNKIRVFMGRRLLHKANCIRIVSNQIRTSLEKMKISASIPVYVLPIVSTLSAFGTLRSPELVEKYSQFNFIALMVCRLEKEKQVDMVIRAWVDILKRHPGAGLIVVGEGSERKRLSSLVRSLGITKSVVFVGWQDDVSPYYAVANMYILTSVYEGYGRTLVEAAAARLSIVTTDVGIVREVFKNGDSAIIIPAGDTKTVTSAIVDAVVRLIGDNVFRDNLAVHAREAVKWHYAVDEEEYIKRVKASFEQCFIL